MKYRIAVVIEGEEGSYSAYAPDVLGCVSAGATIPETLANMQEALSGHLAWMARDGDPMPESEPIEACVVVVEIAVLASARRVG